MDDVARVGPREAAAGSEASPPFEPWTAPAMRAEAHDEPAAEVPGGFWRRAAAFLFDLAIVWLLLRVGDLLAVSLFRRDLLARAFVVSCALVVPAAYFVLFHGTGGQTLGKRLLGVRAVDLGGDPVGYPQALGRFLATALALMPLGLGLLVAAARRDKRGVHDLLAGTRVIVTSRSPE